MSPRYVPPGRATVTRHIPRCAGGAIASVPPVIEVELEYGDTPPSLNKIGTRGSHWATTSAKKLWQGVWESLLMQARVPRNLHHVTASAVLRFPVRRRRDEDNHAWLLAKALGDALVNGWLPDDTPEHFHFAGLTFDPELGPRQTTITLRLR